MSPCARSPDIGFLIRRRVWHVCGMPRSIGIRLATSAFVLSALILATDGHGQPTPESPSPGPERQRLIEDAQEIMRLSSQGQHDAVTKRVDDFISRYSLSQETFPVLLFKAESEFRLGRIDPAIESYQRAIFFVEQLNNVAQRRYVLVFFRLGVLYRQKAQYDPAIRAVEAGLVREPQNVYYQILLGELYRERGDSARALKHFRELLDSGVPTTEERLVLKIKIDRLTTPAPAAPPPRLDLADQPLYSGLSVGIVPLNVSDAGISWPDICVLLESKWLVPCEVLPPVTLDERAILDERRKQYDANQILNELERRYPTGKRAHRFIIAVTGRDIFGTETNFVFSWQDRQTRAGVVSTYRFVANLEDFYERSILATRRLGIQIISTTGSLLGFTRPTKPDCPLAYPHDFREFLMKSSKLCDSTIEQRDALLKRSGGAATRFGPGRADAINRVYRAYYFD